MLPTLKSVAMKPSVAGTSKARSVVGNLDTGCKLKGRQTITDFRKYGTDMGYIWADMGQICSQYGVCRGKYVPK